MTRAGLSWERGPDALGREALAYLARIERAAQRAGERLAEILEDDARAGAPWKDRTGAARRGLFGAAEIVGDMLSIYLSHGPDVPYGLWLEVRHGERFAVIWPTISAHMDEVWGLIRQELG